MRNPYIIASAADEINLYPKGLFEWNGLSSKGFFFKKALDKLEIIPQIFRTGKYKSAVEMMTEKKMSEESREQMSAILEGLWGRILQYAHERTELSLEDLNSLAENNYFLYAEQAKKKGFVDNLASRDDVDLKLVEVTGGGTDKPRYVSWRTFHREVIKPKALTKAWEDKVAIVFASGSIMGAFPIATLKKSLVPESFPK